MSEYSDDEVLVSGFLSAITNFGKSSLGHTVSDIGMGKMRFYFYQEEDLLFVAGALLATENPNQALLESVRTKLSALLNNVANSVEIGTELGMNRAMLKEHLTGTMDSLVFEAEAEAEKATNPSTSPLDKISADDKYMPDDMGRDVKPDNTGIWGKLKNTFRRRGRKGKDV